MIGIKIEYSKGRAKSGKKHVFIRPDYPCFNRSRKASGFYDSDLNEDIGRILRKWFQPELFIYEIDGHRIISNSEKNALSEYWNVCERTDVGKKFEVELKSVGSNAV
jgi:hypothetical protein